MHSILSRSFVHRSMGFGLIVSVGALATLLLTGCGRAPNANFVKDVIFRTYTQDFHSFGEISTVIDTGAITLPALRLPIVDPRMPQVSYGSLGIVREAGKTMIRINVDITEVARLTPAQQAPRLPNDTALPVDGAQSLIALPLGNTRSAAYLSFDRSKLLAGAAIAIRELDSVGAFIGQSNIFLPFNLPRSVVGVAGIFVGRQSGQSGIAFFVDASALLPEVPAVDDQVVPSNGALALLQAPRSYHISEDGSRRISGLAQLNLARLRNQYRFTERQAAPEADRQIKAKVAELHLNSRQVHLQ